VPFESLRNIHVDLFTILERAVEKGALNIEDMNRPIGHDREHPHDAPNF
jgi:hypothetical protein